MKLLGQLMVLRRTLLRRYGTLGRCSLLITDCQRALTNGIFSDNIIIPENGIKIGWKPKWDEKRFLDNINDEIDAVVENGKAKSRLMDSLFVASRG